MSDNELELHIKDLGVLMQDEYANWNVTGCFHARGQADRHRLDMQEAIAARSQAQIERMEAELGLAA